MKDVFAVPVPEVLPKGWHRIRSAVMEAMGATPEECPSFKSTYGVFVTMTLQREQDGNRWLHVSVSRQDRVPNYYELCEVKKIFLGEDALALLLFVPRSEHVNIHPHCLHLWSCLDARPTPDFTWGLGSI